MEHSRAQAHPLGEVLGLHETIETAAELLDKDFGDGLRHVFNLGLLLIHRGITVGIGLSGLAIRARLLYKESNKVKDRQQL
jgi:hypothetical protein